MQRLHGNGEEWWSRFRSLLDDNNDWPAHYMFKFIVPSEELEDMKDVLAEHVGEDVKVRASRKGNYMSVTARRKMGSSEEVITIYKAAGDVEGVIAL